MFNQQDSLIPWGWNAPWSDRFVETLKTCPRIPDLAAGRVVGREGPLDLVETALGGRSAQVSGRLQYAAREDELPLVGDWVVVQVLDDRQAVIHAVLPRRTLLSRAVSEGSKRAPGRQSVLAANLDVLAIVTGLDGNFNPRRAQRLATLARHGGITPLWVLTKTDLPGTEGRVAEAREAAGHDPVVALSSVTGAGVDGLTPWLAAGTTIGLAGSSGVGKTTLVNRLLGTSWATTAVRADSKGRHTTTSRHLYQLPTGAVLMDAPGFRTVGLWADEGDLAEGFGDIEALAQGCRFADCRHEGEPGCAVQGALDRGELSRVRWDGWRRQAKEVVHLARRDDQAASTFRRRR